jgi:multidrug efflux pump
MRLNKLGISTQQVATALSSANANKPKGEFVGPINAWSIDANDQLLEADKYRSLIVASNQNGVVRLSDVADVQDSVEDLRNAGISNGKRAVLLVIFRQPGANIISTVDNVRQLLPELQASISPAIKLDVVMDRTLTVRASVRDIEFTLIISVISSYSFSYSSICARRYSALVTLAGRRWSDVCSSRGMKSVFDGSCDLDGVCCRRRDRRSKT